MEGILGVYKEAGMTSHDVVFRLRKIVHMKKIGHAGTLDPAVTGVLPVCLGKATKVVEYLQESGKVYAGTVTLGKSTTTEDATGEIIEQKNITEAIEDKKIDEKMATFNGWITQIPPMYSAVKVNGRRLYDYAFHHETVERPKRKAYIEYFKRTSPVYLDKEKGEVTFDFEVSCGKGTYVRTLAVDLGKLLHLPSHMSSLTRIKAGGFSLEHCLTLDQIEEKMSNGTLEQALKPIEELFIHYPRIDLTEELFYKVKNGMPLPQNLFGITDENQVIAMFYQHQLFSLYAKHPSKKGYFKPQKVFKTELNKK